MAIRYSVLNRCSHSEQTWSTAGSAADYWMQFGVPRADLGSLIARSRANLQLPGCGDHGRLPIPNSLIWKRKYHAKNRNSGVSDIDGCGGMQHAMQRVYPVRGQRIAASCLSRLRFHLPMGARHRRTPSFRCWRVRPSRPLLSVADCACQPGRLPALRARRHDRAPAAALQNCRPSLR
jgi:hypothetical protein